VQSQNIHNEKEVQDLAVCREDVTVHRIFSFRVPAPWHNTE
jgi:hypothetical protein